MARPLSISLRLGMLFAAIAATVFVAVGAYLYQTLSHQMGRRDDVDLISKGVLVRQLLQTLPDDARLPDQVQAMFGRVIGEDGVMLRVTKMDGPSVAGLPVAPMADSRPPVPVDREPEPGDIVGRVGPGGGKRVLSMLARSRSGVLRVTLERMRSDRLAILKRYAFDLLGALASGALLATALSFVAVRRSLRPVYAVAGKANDISAHRLQTRLAADDVPVELRDFCLAFNAMLDRLEDGVQRLSGFAADLAHDLRTPVNALMMQTQVALSRERTSEDYQALLASNQDEYERLARLIENTLFLARADSAQLAIRCAVLDIQAELTHIRDYFEMLAEDKGIDLRLEPLPPVALWADPVLFRRAVNNLVSNAIEHTPANGTISVGLREGCAGPELFVTNTGPGVAPEHVDHLFERFYRADSARSGGHSAGLGLAIVRAIMHLHEGTAHLDGKLGDGTVFVLCFPARPAGSG
jgi:two-component system heavy metal sensor histidine kinase CusS